MMLVPFSSRGSYYDGVSSRPIEVVVHFNEQGVQVKAEDFSNHSVQRHITWSSIEVGEAFENLPRFFYFRDTHIAADGQVHHRHDFIEIPNQIQVNHQLNALLKHLHPAKASFFSFLAKPNSVIVMVLGTIAFLAASYFVALPFATEKIATAIPLQWTEPLDKEVLKQLDAEYFKPSKLSAAEQEKIAQSFQAWINRLPNVPVYHLQFRASPVMGANAMALPGGTLILTDELLALADPNKPEEVYAVFGHEVGHLARRHSLRTLVQASIVGFAAGYFLGDISSVLASGAATVLTLHYSRGHELEADAFAAKALHANQQTTEPMIRLLSKLESSHKAKTADSGNQKSSSGWEDYLSTHPKTNERIQRLRTLQ